MACVSIRSPLAQVGLVFFVFVALLLAAAAMVYAERKLAAGFQQRRGPNRVGPMGLLQPFADVFKLMFKEQLRPRGADQVLFLLAPVISCACAFAAFAVVPFGAETTLFGLLPEPIGLYVADVNVAILVIFAIASMSVYGIVLAGWASNSKYSLLGALQVGVADDQLRGLVRPRAGRGADPRRIAVARRDRRRGRMGTGLASCRGGSSSCSRSGSSST